ncbi:acetyltransferase (GNAT) family protein [Herbihabitans rhizosphaerae]|uniref:Acetyltransferase (GNAT) family protein n=1 Tax=Herbihabitans rhizosphaerae TaxID=1872711 RepID=A0A4V2ES10_9PSEU|nr:acetyltransferase (GNAT) family protein [Herbihabitans rhizosphaerae]
MRIARPDDVDEITEIQARTWRFAYAKVLPEAVLAELDTEAARSDWADALAGGAAEVHVATEGDWTVGFCAAGHAPESEVADANGALPADAATIGLIATLLVEPRWARRGHGGRLLHAAATGLRNAGATRGIAWLPEADTASRKFYTRAGWAEDGTVRVLDAGGTPVRELRVTGPLTVTLQD